MKDYIKCQICGSCINFDTDSQLIECACGAIAVDGSKHYIRVLGKKEDWQAYKDGIKCDV